MDIYALSLLDANKPNSPEEVEQQISELKESWEMIKSPYTRLSSLLLNRSATLTQSLASARSSSSAATTNFGQGLLDSISDFASLELNNDCSLEVVSMSEELRAALFDEENNYYIPELIGESEIIKEGELEELGKFFMANAEGHPLCLLFTTSTSGFSLSTLFRACSQLEPSTPTLLLIENTKGEAFGALISNTLRPSDQFYGNGQSFLFSLRGDFQVFKWTGVNSYFVRGGAREGEGLVFGAGDGHFGIYIDSDLNLGRSDTCATFANAPLAEDKDFVVKTIECWAFYNNNTNNAIQTAVTKEILNSPKKMMSVCQDDDVVADIEQIIISGGEGEEEEI